MTMRALRLHHLSTGPVFWPLRIPMTRDEMRAEIMSQDAYATRSDRAPILDEQLPPPRASDWCDVNPSMDALADYLADQMPSTGLVSAR